MTANDQFTLGLLGQLLTDESTSSDTVTRWWQSERTPSEGLAEFLARKRVLTGESVRTIPLAAKGYLRLDASTVLCETAGPRLRSLATPQDSRPLRAAPPAELVGSVPAQPELRRTRRTDVVVPKAGRSTHPPTETRFVQAPTNRHQIGKKIGRCLLTRVLGEGGGGVVYQALHQGLGIPVAVKVLRDEAKSPGVRAALKAEARLLAQLNHPNIVRVLDFDDEAEDPYLVIEYVEGFSLADLIGQCGWLRPEHAAGLMIQAALGLGAALRVGVIHRDVKPGNILMTKDGQVKIADLGLAACSNARLVLESGAVDASLGGIGGTVAYMGPERFSASGPTDCRSDIYSLGVTFFEALTGRLPFEGATSLAMMIEHVQTPFPDVQKEAPAASAEGAALIAKMCAKRPGDRFQTYEELVAALSETFQLIPEHASVVTWNSKWQPLTRVDSSSLTGRHPLTER